MFLIDSRIVIGGIIIIVRDGEERAIAHHGFTKKGRELGNLWTDVIHESFA